MLTTDAARYLGDVAAHLSHLPRAEREAVLADLADTLSAGVTPADLGAPADYAATVTPSPAGDHTPRILGLPFASRRSPLWNPGDPRLLLPKQFGIGWTVNLGAVAVKLGWLRPDDADSDVLASAPPAAWMTSALIPAACEAVTLGACVVAWRRAVDGKLPANIGMDGRPNFWADRGLVVGATYAIAVVSTVVGVTTSFPGERSILSRLATPEGLDPLAVSGAAPATAPPPLPASEPERAESDAATERSLSRVVGASATGALAAAAAVIMASAAKDPDRARPWTAPMLLATPAAAALAAALIPIRTGLSRVARSRR